MLDALETCRRALQMHTPEGDAEALDIASTILVHEPMNGHAAYLAGTSFLRMKQPGLAAMAYNMALMSNKDEPSIWNNLGCALREYHPKEAVNAFMQALELDPTHVEANKNLAACLGRVGEREKAIAINTRLRGERPDDHDIPYNLALDLLHTTDWRAAFEAYVYSEGNAQRKIRNYHIDKETPRWDGTDNGQKVVLYGEQGVGDEVLASVSYAAHIAQSPSCEFIIDCDKRLEKLFKRSFPDATVYGTRCEEALAWPVEEKPDASLIAMAAFGELMDPSTKAAPWLEPDPALVDMFKSYLDALGPGKKIGLSWTGGKAGWDRAERSIDPDLLTPITAIPDAVVISLEYSDGPVPEGVHTIPWATQKGVDLDVTCALVAALDVVVSVPQTVCDLAGAVGTPLKALVSHNPPWRFAEAAGDAWVWEDVTTYRKKEQATWLPSIAKCARDLRMEWGLMP